MTERGANINSGNGDESSATHSHDAIELLALPRNREFNPPEKMLTISKVLVGLGVAIFLIGLFMDPQRLWGSVLLNSYYLLGLALAGLFLIAVQYLSSAGWGVVLRRIPEAMVALLPYGLAGISLVLLLRPSLYSWVGLVRDDPILVGFRGFWLSYGFFLARAVLYGAIWLAFARAILRHSRAQDRDGNVSHTHRNTALSAGFVVLFSLSFWLASFDWVMSLEPTWFSTIFGVYNFAGLFSSGLACVVIIVVWLQGQGVLRGIVTEEHLHDLGKLLVGFTCFWAYIWFSQYMLIWYANIPEETEYFIVRSSGAWGVLLILNVMLNWVVPFLALLPRGSKRSGSFMVKIALVILAGRWLDLYLMIFPSLSKNGPPFGLYEIGLTLGAAGLFGVIILAALSRAPLVPLKDPLLRESMHHHQ